MAQLTDLVPNPDWETEGSMGWIGAKNDMITVRIGEWEFEAQSVFFFRPLVGHAADLLEIDCKNCVASEEVGKGLASLMHVASIPPVSLKVVLAALIRNTDNGTEWRQVRGSLAFMQEMGGRLDDFTCQFAVSGDTGWKSYSPESKPAVKSLGDYYEHIRQVEDLWRR